MDDASPVDDAGPVEDADPVADAGPVDDAGPANPYTALPARPNLAETSTTHDTSVADSTGSFGALSTSWPAGVALGPEGAGDGD